MAAASEPIGPRHGSRRTSRYGSSSGKTRMKRSPAKRPGKVAGAGRPRRACTSRITSRTARCARIGCASGSNGGNASSPAGGTVKPLPTITTGMTPKAARQAVGL